MENGACAPSSLPEIRCSVSETPTCGDEEELDEETMECISALYKALGPLMPAVTQLQSHQEPPAHLMVDMKAKLKELGSSVSDARKKMLRYNIYLKKKLARAMQERIALREQLLRPQDLGTEQASPAPLLPRETQSEVEPEKPSMEAESTQEMEAPETLQLKPSERVPWRERRRTQEVHFAPEEASEDQGWSGLTAEGFLRKIASKVDNILASHASVQKSLF